VRRLVALLAPVVIAAVACGSSSPSRLDQAQDAMAHLDRGRIDVELTAATPSTEPVGFSVSGPFSLRTKGDLPVFDLRYRLLLGAKSEDTQVRSTGTAMFVETGGRVVEVPAALQRQLRLGDGSGGFADLGVEGWVLDGHESTSGDVTTIKGHVDVPDLLGDIARVVAQIDGRAGASLSDDQADALRSLARDSEIDVVLKGGDHLPQSIHAVVDFGGRVPAELRQALGHYAAAKLDLTVRLRRLDTALTVAPPR
jgi:hypothetical protein